VSIDATLLRRAKALKINLSRTLEERLTELIREGGRQEWLRENQEAIDDYNRRIERRGVFSEGLRRF
jgi:antitoxin CcdA